MTGILEVALYVAGILEELDVPYLVGGSLASSLHGIPRATQDADLLADLESDQVSELVARLQGSFYIDARAVDEAVRSRSSFNVIHLETMFKVDVFVAKKDPATRTELARRQRYVLDEAKQQEVVVASAEDIVVQKLLWYKMGGEVSDRQWNDVLGVLKVQGSRLEQVYLRDTARQLGVEALLERAFRASV